MCNIVCNGHNDNPVCGSDSVTYETPCHVREASCLKQMKIDIRHVGRCQGNVAPDTRSVCAMSIVYRASVCLGVCRVCVCVSVYVVKEENTDLNLSLSPHC